MEIIWGSLNETVEVSETGAIALWFIRKTVWRRSSKAGMGLYLFSEEKINLYLLSHWIKVFLFQIFDTHNVLDHDRWTCSAFMTTDWHDRARIFRSSHSLFMLVRSTAVVKFQFSQFIKSNFIILTDVSFCFL